MLIMAWIFILIVSLFTLIKASDYFTTSAEKIGIFFGIPSFIIGVTAVAFGTSMPELVSSIFAVIKKSPEIVAGNVVGSNICNIFLVLGLSAVISKKIKLKHEIMHVDLPFLIGSSFILAIFISDGIFNLAEAIISILGMILYLSYSASARRYKIEERGDKIWKSFAIFIISAFFIYLGAKYTIKSVIQISEILHIGKEIIAVSIVALGTSLPELMVSLMAAKKGFSEIAVGNILGSNIFNTFAVMGIPALIMPFSIPKSIITIALPLMIIATLLFALITYDKEITRWEGYLLLIFYAIFIAKMFGMF